jgi:hypothetical protein
MYTNVVMRILRRWNKGAKSFHKEESCTCLCVISCAVFSECCERNLQAPYHRRQASQVSLWQLRILWLQRKQTCVKKLIETRERRIQLDFQFEEKSYEDTSLHIVVSSSRMTTKLQASRHCL